MWSSKWTEVCRVTISSYLSVIVGSGYRAEYYFIYFPVLVHTTQGRKRVVLQVGGSVEVCRVTISSYLSVRVGSGYRAEYYFIYFPVLVHTTQGSEWSSKWTVVWMSAGSPFPATYQ